MLKLLDFLYRQRIFLLFILLEGLSFWLIVSYNHRYNSYYLNSSNRISGGITEAINSIETFIHLHNANQALAEENLSLRRALASKVNEIPDEITSKEPTLYKLAQAKIVNSSHRKAQNYLTLRVDPIDSVLPGMGVVSAEGVVGTVKSVSKHFATVTSLLHPNLLVSARVKSNNALATVQWAGENPIEAELKYVPRHLKLEVGDSIVTSGFNAIYPEGFHIGVVSSTNLKRENPFYTARVILSTDFTKVSTVYVIKVMDRKEKENLEEEVSGE